MPRGGPQGPIVEGVSADAGPSYTLVVPLFDHAASDGALDSERPDGLAIEQDAPQNAEGVRIGTLPGQPGCEGRERAVAEVGGSNGADGDSGNLAGALHEEAHAWLHNAQDDCAWREAMVREMREG